MVAMDTNKSPEIWDQLTNESGRAYEAFKIFMFMSPAERTVARTWREWTDNPEANRPSPFFEGGRGSTLGQSVPAPMTPT